MTWTYSGDPASSDRDEVRFLVGDTDTTDQLISDEEIAYAVANETNNVLAAAEVARAIAAKFARTPDQSIGDLSYSYSQRHAHFLELSKKLVARGNVSGATPFAGGITISGKETVEEDTDRTPPGIKKGIHNYDSAIDQEDDC